MRNRIIIKRSDIVFYIAVIFILGFIFGVSLAPQNVQKTVSFEREQSVNTILPAVDSSGDGVVATLSTTVKPGTGKILVDASNVLNYIDTQLSGRVAAQVAAEQANVNLDEIDVVYTINVNASLIEGPSAGASMAVSVLMALENRSPGNVAITGTINPDGTIGRVGSVFEKARAAKENGIKTFLVPVGQDVSESTRRVRTCENVNSFEVCRISYRPSSSGIGDVLNITVIEVRNIEEAFRYFSE